MLKGIKRHILRNSDILRLNHVQCDYFLKRNLLIGGGNRVFTIKYNNVEYKFEESPIDDNYFVLWSREENPFECVSILISKKDYNAEIHGIGNYEKCIADTNTKVGSTLLKITLKMLKKYKDKFKIKTITLTDNSLKDCKNINKRIILSKMLILLTGETWYGRYGFRPFNYENKLDKILNENYETNIKIMNEITISKANILKYIKLTNKKNIIDDVVKLIKSHPNLLLKDFIKNFINKYDKFCKYFYLFYEELYKHIGLTNLHKQHFGLLLE
jgi:hypothetical protein